jgi:hypothetical protein
MTTPLAQLSDYEMLIAPVAAADEPKIDYLILVASSVVAQFAPGLMPWAQGTPPLESDGVTPTPVPEPAVLVTCQTTSNIVNNPTGNGGRIQMQRVGFSAEQYAPGGDVDGLLPVAWRRLLKPWRAPVMASIPLTVPHPMEYGMGGWGWTWWFPTLEGEAPPDPSYYDGWGENVTEWPWSTTVPPSGGAPFSDGVRD